MHARTHGVRNIVWLTEDIRSILESVDRANADLAECLPTHEVAIYRRGFTAAIVAVAAAFGVEVPQKQVQDVTWKMLEER